MLIKANEIPTDAAPPAKLTDESFAKWCVALVDYLTPIRERFTPFPRYFEVQIFNFVTMRALLHDLFPFDRRYERVLEIGCGVGAHSLLLSRFADQLVGVDIPGEYAGYVLEGYKSSAEVAKALVNKEFGVKNATFLDAFPDKLPADNDSVDIVFSWTVLEHIPKLPPAYAEMMRVLKPGGRMIHVAPNTMSAIHTMASVNVESEKQRRKPLGYIGALKKIVADYLALARGTSRDIGMTIPPCHSEFLTDYQDQLTLYISWEYLIPLIRLGMIVERIVPVTDFNYALVLRKP